MKIGFAARWSPLDKRSWSGTSHFTFEQIKKRFETEIYHFKWTWRLREWLTMQKSLNRRLFGTQTSVEFLRSYSKYFSKKLTDDLKKRPVDCLFVSASSQLIAYLETDIPVIYMTDATFYQLQGYYPGFSNLPKYNIRQGVELDKKAFQRSDHCMLASSWNKNSAIGDYGIEAAKITVVPCGANLDEVPSYKSLQFNSFGKCRLLFLGVEWERKGGDIVLDAFRKLKLMGINAGLHIIGCRPPHEIAGESGITVIPFLDKNNHEDARQLDGIFRESDLLFLPTRAECAGVVFSEASSYGIPSITTDTGGVSTYVKDGINGYIFPKSAGGSEYAEKIASLINDQVLMAHLKRSSRQYYDENLTWDSWGEKFTAIASQLARPSGF